MAGYSIVLNLTGNAVTNAEKLAASLGKADVSAKSLASTIGALNASLNGVNVSGVNALNASLAAARVNAAALSRETSIRQAGRHSRQATTYTRHKSNRVASYGYGFNIGGFSGRLSTILQPDENGQILGLNAAKLSRNLNVAGIAANLATSIGKALLKATAISTVAPLVIGGLGIRAAIKTLQSESFAEGVRLISRRHQAALGLGAGFEQANSNADFLAAAYGFDRSTALSSINVLTGLGVGGAGRKLDLNEATGLTKIGGLISQHQGVPFERVMTNIQQLLVQDKPHIRDIRELLNQAPILGKYALREIESKGLVGVDIRDYLKDQKNILSVLKQYELDIASNAGLQARGRIGLAQQDLWANIASNGQFWGYVGEAGSGIINSISKGGNALLSNLATNDTFKVMVKQIELFFDNLGTKGVTLFDKLILLVDGLAAKYGIDLGNRSDAGDAVQRANLVSKALTENSTLQNALRAVWENSGLPVSSVAEVRNKEFSNFIEQATSALRTDEKVLASIVGAGKLYNISDFNYFERLIGGPIPTEDGRDLLNVVTANKMILDNTDILNGNVGLGTVLRPEIKNLQSPHSRFAEYGLMNAPVIEAFQRIVRETEKIGGLDPGLFKSTGQFGDDLTGFNKDRKALEIHFHREIVSWNSSITTNNTQEVADYVTENLQYLTAEAIQKALLAATGKSGSRWS